jgi:hypothetical protein
VGYLRLALQFPILLNNILIIQRGPACISYIVSTCFWNLDKFSFLLPFFHVSVFVVTHWYKDCSPRRGRTFSGCTSFVFLRFERTIHVANSCQAQYEKHPIFGENECHKSTNPLKAPLYPPRKYSIIKWTQNFPFFISVMQKFVIVTYSHFCVIFST